jgi:hypothetical protein
MGNFAMLLKVQGKVDEAEPLARECLAAQKEILGDKHASTLNTEGNLGLVRIEQQEPDGLPMVESVLQQLRAEPHQLPDSHPWIKKFSAALKTEETQ